MVKWRGRRQSRNVEDRRGAAAAGGAGIILMLLRFIVGRFGIRGVNILGLVGAGLYMAGVNPLALLQGQPAGQQTAEPVDDETSQFVRVVLAETEDVWSQLFAAAGGDYPEPTLVMFSGSVSSACGYASAASGPFYCPADQKLYLDASFFTELAQRFGAPGDFAAAYVIAHEVGHHVQTVTGTSREVRSAQQRAQGEGEANALQVRMELQADCYAGVWAHHAEGVVDGVDERAIRAELTGLSFEGQSDTHGSGRQRAEWFVRGYRSGRADACDTLGPDWESL